MSFETTRKFDGVKGGFRALETRNDFGERIEARLLFDGSVEFYHSDFMDLCPVRIYSDHGVHFFVAGKTNRGFHIVIIAKDEFRWMLNAEAELIKEYEKDNSDG